MDQFIYSLNNDKVFAGFMMLLMNIGGRYISKEVPDSVDLLFQNVWLRRAVVFGIAFIATRDIITAIFITFLFILVFNYLINEKSAFCILPERFQPKKDLKALRTKET